MLGGFGGKVTPTTSNERKTPAGSRRALPYAKLRLLSLVREIISIRLTCPGAQEKKTGMLLGRKKFQEAYISRMRGATPSGRIPTKLGKCVRLTDVSKRAKFHCYNLRDFGAMRC